MDDRAVYKYCTAFVCERDALHLEVVLAAICGVSRPRLTPAYKLCVWPSDMIPNMHFLLSDLCLFL